MRSAQRRLAACVDELRACGGAAEQQQLTKKLLKELFAVQRLYKPELLAGSNGDAKPAKKKPASASLFALLYQTLLVYSGGLTGGSSNGAGGGAPNLSMSLSSSTPATSECVRQLIIDLLVRAFDYSVVPMINDGLAAKTTSLYVKASLANAVCRLPLQDALQFVPEVVALANKAIRTADYYIKQILLEAVANALAGGTPRLSTFHGEALKVVIKVYQDKAPEVRIAAAKLLAVIAANTTASVSATSSGSGGLSVSGTGGSSSGSSGPSSGGSSSAGATAGSLSGSGGPSSSSSGGSGSGGTNGSGVTLEAIMQVAAKGMDDVAVAARCEFASVVGLVVAKFATLSCSEGDLQSSGDNGSTGPLSTGKSHHDDDDTGRNSDSDVGANSGSLSASRSKLPFKLKSMHVPGMAGINLSRRKAAAFNFSTIASVILYFKDMVVTKHVSSNPAHSNGGILSSFAIALCGMFRQLPPDSVADTQIHEVLDAMLAILDHPFSLGDLARARNAVSFAMRNGLFLALTERQQDVLLGIYLQRLYDDGSNAEANHHKMLSILVEVSHSLHAMGEAAAAQSRDSSAVLQGLLCHEKQSVRFQAAVALAALVTALPCHLKGVLLNCLDELERTAEMLLSSDKQPSPQQQQQAQGQATEDGMSSPMTAEDADQRSDLQSKTHLYAIQGRSTAIAHVLRALSVDKQHQHNGLSVAVLDRVFRIAQELVESQFMDACADSVWLTCTRAGWTVVSSLATFRHAHWVRANLQALLNLWLKSSVLHNRESSLELLRIEAAVMSLSAFLACYKSGEASSSPTSAAKGKAVTAESIHVLANHVLHVYLTAVQGEQLVNPRKRRGQVARFRVVAWLLKCFALLPPIYTDSYVLLLDLVAEHTTAQALTSLRQSPLGAPAESTFLQLILSPGDDVLELVSAARLMPGDAPSALYSREINLSLALQQPENALTDTEVEVQYMDNFMLAASTAAETSGMLDGVCSSATHVRIVDACVHLFGRLFHYLPEDLQLRCLQHFAGILVDDRSVDCQINVCALLFAVVRETKSFASKSGGPSLLPAASWPSQVQTMLCEMIASDNGKVRRGAGEALGLLAAALPDENRRALIIDIEKRLVADKLPSGSIVSAAASTISAFTSAASSSPPSSGEHLPDPNVLFAGAAFALASIKRACGSGIAVDSALIFRFAGEIAQPLRTWVLHAWSLIMESVTTTVGDYEPFIQSTFALMEAQLLAGFTYSRKANKKGLRWQSSAKAAIGRIINGIIASVGPELGAGSSSSDRLSELFNIWQLLRCRFDGDSYRVTSGGGHDGDNHIELQYVQFLEQVAVLAPAKFRCADFGYVLGAVSDLAPAIALPGAWLTSSSSGGDVPAGAVISAAAGNSATGLSRALLQRVALSCLRTIVERDPALIRRYNLHCLLFAALHGVLNELNWRYLPRLHGLWEPLTFTEAISSMNSQQSGVEPAEELRASILALLELDGGRRSVNAQPCVWALLCRSIAIGESSNNFSGETGADDDQLMMSPKGVGLGLGLGSNGDGDEDDDVDSNAKLSAGAGTSAVTGTRELLVSAAIAAQVEAWRVTKKRVSDLVALLPPLSRHVRHFAVECVLRVFELVSECSGYNGNGYGTTASDAARHFDLVKTRAFYLARLANKAAAGAGPDYVPNFLCMYLDEFVTLACHVSTSSADASELQMFQSTGLRLINVLLTRFGAARDPEVSTGDALLLDPYQAQLSAALRHALKQTHAADEDAKGSREFYAPLLIEAHAVCASAISARLVQDKVALNRILKMLLARDYGHAHYIGDDVTRTRLALANLSSVAHLLESAIRLDGPASEQSAAGGRRSRLSGALTTAMVKALAGNIEYLIQCWTDATLACALGFQGNASSPAAEGGDSLKLAALGLVVPRPAAHHEQLDAYRECYRCYWPSILSVLVCLQTYMPELYVTKTKDNSTPAVLAALALLHVSSWTTSGRDRSDSEIVPVLQALPPLVTLVWESGDASLAADVAQNVMSSLITVSVRSPSGAVRVEALRALSACISQKELLGAATETSESFVSLVARVALSPLEVLYHLVNDMQRSTAASSDATGGDESDPVVLDVVRLATSGIVFLHTSTDSRVRNAVVDAAAMVERCLEPMAAACATHSATRDAAVALSRASVEAALALSRTVDTDEDRDPTTADDLVTRLRSRWVASFAFVSRWVGNASASPSSTDQLAFALRVAANFAARFPSFVRQDAAALHATLANTLVAVVAARTPESADRTAPALQGLLAIVKKLVDAQELAIAHRYLSLAGPHLLPIVQEAASADAMDAAEQFLGVLTAQLDDASGAAFVQLVLPKLCVLLLHNQQQQSPPLSSVVGRLLLLFAQTRAVAFKQAVGAMSPASRSVLETTLRSAISGASAASAAPASSSAYAPAPPASMSFQSGAFASAKKLDLSRYG